MFLVSWRNIPPELGGLAWDDYLESGVLQAIEVAQRIIGQPQRQCARLLRRRHAAGERARGARRAQGPPGRERHAADDDARLRRSGRDRRLRVVRISCRARAALLAGQRLLGSELASAFASLRANDLVWNYVVNNYLKGETPPAFDLLYWNSDSANLPGPMYAYYLRNMYVDNRLREPGALTMLGERVDLGRIALPVYVMAARDDHIVPWRSGLSDDRPGQRRHHVRAGRLGPHRRGGQSARGAAAQLLDQRPRDRRPGRLARARRKRRRQLVAALGSWLRGYGGARHPAPAATGNKAYPPLDPAPGTYVRPQPLDLAGWT